MKKFLVLFTFLLLLASVCLAEDTVTVYDFESGVPSVFLQSGSSAPRVSDAQRYAGTHALHVTGRSGNNWDAVDLNSSSLGIDAGVPVTVTCHVWVDSGEEGTFVIAKAAGDYATLGKVNCPGRTWTEVKAEFTLDQQVNIRFQNLSENWNLCDYYIDDMTITVGEKAAAAEEESSAPPIDYASDFSAGTDGWYARSAGGAEIAITDEASLRITGRSATWNSPGRDFALVAGKTYNLSVLVKQDELEECNFILSVAHSADGVESYENLGNANARKGEWTLIQCTYIAPPYDNYILYVEGGQADTSFEIKDFTCAEQTLKYGKAGIKSLKEVYAPYFDFGTAVVGNEVLDG
ncbi:MAG: hypothetical protein E7326_04250, partial [Clostridiales bacterium]|nr:hypothetical protein [Clostridiales bacterium]